MKTKIIIADDHQMVIDGLQLLLNRNDEFCVAGTATNGTKALELILSLKPQVALLDLRMPEKDGLQVTRYLHDNEIPTQTIIMSMHGDKRYITDAKNYGARGYILKNAGMHELYLAINEVIKGATYFVSPKQELHAKNPAELTPRELDVINLIINEHTTLQIAEQLHLSHYTVETHRKNILRKTGAKNLAGLVKFAIDNNILLT
ncbi:MAG: response regulator transcription factor [Bacteroidota bacterium]